MGLLMFDHVNHHEYFPQSSQPSTFARSLSDFVAPFIFDDEPIKLWDYEYAPCATNTQYWPRKITDPTYTKYQLDQELANIDALFEGC